MTDLERTQEDNRFWINIWRYAALCFCVLVLGPVACNLNKQRILNNMVDKGYDPIEASCAVYIGEFERNSICVILVTKSNAEKAN